MQKYQLMLYSLLTKCEFLENIFTFARMQAVQFAFSLKEQNIIQEIRCTIRFKVEFHQPNVTYMQVNFLKELESCCTKHEWIFYLDNRRILLRYQIQIL